MLDFYLEKHLLYDPEVQPYQEAVLKAKDRQLLELQKASKPSKSNDFKTNNTNKRTKAVKTDVPPASVDLPESSRDSVISGNSSVQLPSLLTPPGSTPTTPQSIQVLRNVQDWRLLPDM